MSHCDCLRRLDLAGRCDHRLLRREYLDFAFVLSNGYLGTAECAEVVGIVAHFHAVGEESAYDAAEETTADCCHSVREVWLVSRR